MTELCTIGELPGARKADCPRAARKKGENPRNSEEESFEPEYHQAKKMGYQINKSKFKVGEWSYQENQVYLQFMIDNSLEFRSESARRRSKVFYRLSKILKKRTPDQCRSHHQKLQIKFKDDLHSIVTEVYRKIQKSIAQEYVEYQHRLQFPPPPPLPVLSLSPSVPALLPPKELQRTAEEEWGRREIEGGWFAISQQGNSFRVVIREEEVGSYQGHP